MADHPLGLFGLAVLAFAATNVDGFVLLAVLFADPGLRTAEVVVGAYLGTVVLIALSGGAAAAFLAPAGWTRWLGLVPILIGLLRLSTRGAGGAGGPGEGQPLRAAPRRGAGPAGRVLAVALVVVADGGDNVSTYIPLFAAATGPQVAAVVVLFLVLTGILCALSHAAARSPVVGQRLQAVAPGAVPAVLIAIGVLLLLRSNGAASP